MGGLFAATPANIPTECSRSQPESCPTDLYGLNLIKAPAVWNALPGIVNEEPSERVMVLDTGRVDSSAVESLLLDTWDVAIYLQWAQQGQQQHPTGDSEAHGLGSSGTIVTKAARHLEEVCSL